MSRHTKQARTNTLPLSHPFTVFILGALAFFAVSIAAFFLPGPIHFALIVPQIVVFLGGALLYQRSRFSESVAFPTLRRTNASPLTLLLIGITTLFVGFLGNSFINLLVLLFDAYDQIESYHAQMREILLPDSIGLQILGVFAVAIVAPVCEEIFFRGALLSGQRRAQTYAASILLNGLLFSVLHGNPLTAIALWLIGAYLAHITLRSGSLWPAIIAHAVLNFVNGVILLRIVETPSADNALGLAPTLLAIAIFSIPAILLWRLTIRRLKDQNPAPYGEPLDPSSP